ncbi:MAG: hypothetical protein ACP5G0_08840 [Desulfomonilia bacterium]
MKEAVVAVIIVLVIGSGSVVCAQESSPDCDCEKGGLGLKVGNFVCAFGGKSFKSRPGCDTLVGVGIGVGSDMNRLQIGVGYDMGLVGIGIGLKGPERTRSFGFSIGYDYSDCRMVWPYEEFK